MQHFRLFLSGLALLTYCQITTSHENADSSASSSSSPTEDLASQHRLELSRRAILLERRQHEQPVSIRKMPADPNVMFFPDYWGYSCDPANAGRGHLFNSTVDICVAQPAILRIELSKAGASLARRSPADPRWLFGSSPLQKRSFDCPSGTDACGNINRADACCPTGLICNIVANTGQGDVGCCEGTGCAGELGRCQAGYSECTQFGGGCCIPGYECVQGGCMLLDTRTVTLQPATTLSSSSSSTPSPTTSSSTASPTTSTSASSSPSPEISTASFLPPARPTSAPPLTTAAPAPSACPTGFYQCSAFYNSGACCQVGRDCGTTSCPAPAPSQTVAGGAGGVTVLAPSNGQQPAQGNCAQGWFSCPASVGGDCCPSGFSCGTASCFLNATATTGDGTNGGQASSTPKEKPTPNSDVQLHVPSSLLLVLLSAALLL